MSRSDLILIGVPIATMAFVVLVWVRARGSLLKKFFQFSQIVFLFAFAWFYFTFAAPDQEPGSGELAAGGIVFAGLFYLWPLVTFPLGAISLYFGRARDA